MRETQVKDDGRVNLEINDLSVTLLRELYTTVVHHAPALRDEVKDAMIPIDDDAAAWAEDDEQELDRLELSLESEWQSIIDDALDYYKNQVLACRKCWIVHYKPYAEDDLVDLAEDLRDEDPMEVDQEKIDDYLRELEAFGREEVEECPAEREGRE